MFSLNFGTTAIAIDCRSMSAKVGTLPDDLGVAPSGTPTPSKVAVNILKWIKKMVVSSNIYEVIGSNALQHTAVRLELKHMIQIITVRYLVFPHGFDKHTVNWIFFKDPPAAFLLQLLILALPPLAQLVHE